MEFMKMSLLIQREEMLGAFLQNKKEKISDILSQNHSNNKPKIMQKEKGVVFSEEDKKVKGEQNETERKKTSRNVKEDSFHSKEYFSQEYNLNWTIL